ncbi:MAG: NAD(P)/FAD-dependent oxidoreductase [Bacteroidota bacterium]
MIKRIELVLLPEEAANEEQYLNKIAQFISCAKEEITDFRLLKKSIDARSRQVKFRLFFDVALGEKLPAPEGIERDYKNVSNCQPVHIIGFGPAGMFAALRLIELGYKPVVFERGKDVRSRRRDLAAINKQGLVNENSNYCYGEGGAGTYSDGKLYTRSGKRGNILRILHTFCDFGADPSILIEAHPHIGTNKLPHIVTRMREFIESCGGEVHFNSRLEELVIENKKIKGLKIASVENNNVATVIKSDAVLLATGHSARDIFRMLHQQHVLIEAKEFALGVRIEHPQSIIDQSQYHCDLRGDFLPPASYSLTTQAFDRGVYSFCMCPGGIIAPASTAPGELVVNGWSPSKRNNPFANSGMVVSVNMQDYAPFKKWGALAGIEFQSQVEKNCFAAGGGNLVAPAQRVVDFCEGKASKGLIQTSYIPGVSNTALGEVLPNEITQALRAGIREFGKKIKGYYSNEGVVVGTESRTSSPVRIPRDHESLMHIEITGLFPCAEGAGYAGGIVSAAMDGEKCAEAIVEFIQP